MTLRRASTLKIIKAIENAMNVFRVPMFGISNKTGRKAPNRLPTVPIAYTRPAMAPVWRTSPVASRMANGDTKPSKVMGIAIRTSTPNKEPQNTPREVLLIP